MSEAATLLLDALAGRTSADRLLKGATAATPRAPSSPTVAPADLREAASFVHSGLDARFVISVGTDCRPIGRRLPGRSHLLAGPTQDVDRAARPTRRRRRPDGAVDHAASCGRPAWAEREFQDLLGIRAEGHPDPRRLVLPDDWPAALHPLRRDVPYDIHPEPAARPGPADGRTAGRAR